MKYTGTVQKGNQYGRILGFPTANIPLSDTTSGVFAASVRCEGVMYGAVVFANQKHSVLEAHLLDFNGDLYGKEIEIELLKQLRERVDFSTEIEAKEVIGKDVAAARTYLNSR